MFVVAIHSIAASKALFSDASPDVKTQTHGLLGRGFFFKDYCQTTYQTNHFSGAVKLGVNRS